MILMAILLYEKERKSIVVDTIFQGELFFFSPTEENWWNVFKMWNSEGYIHSSRIKNIKALTTIEKKDLIDSIFNIEIKLSSISLYKQTHQERENSKIFWEERFTPILEMFAEYICETKDKELFEKFKTIIYQNGGSADETPSWTLGMIFVCQPDWTIEMITTATGYSVLKDHLKWGFMNVVPYVEDSKEYKALYDKFNKIK